MIPFDYEQVERPDESTLIYHNVTALKRIGPIKKGEYFSKVKHNVDTNLVEFFFLDKLICVFYLEDEFGLLPGQYEMILKSQNGKCGICKQIINKTLCVDHDHQTNKIRGLLCINCNTKLGWFENNPVQQYLEENS